jgi:hypothetical protein
LFFGYESLKKFGKATATRELSKIGARQGYQLKEAHETNPATIELLVLFNLGPLVSSHLTIVFLYILFHLLLLLNKTGF